MPDTSIEIKLPPIKLERHNLYLIGTTPLLVHGFPPDARAAMLIKQTKEAKGGRDARQPVAEFKAARYLLPDGRHGFPVVAFKASAVTACTSLADVTKVAARQAFRLMGVQMTGPGVLTDSFVRSSLVPLIAPEPGIREDVVKLSGPGRKSELRYRPEYWPWGVVLDVILNPQAMSISHLGSMFNLAGNSVGVGEYRSERNGDCGYFDLVGAKDFEQWRKEHNL